MKSLYKWLIFWITILVASVVAFTQRDVIGHDWSAMAAFFIVISIISVIWAAEELIKKGRPRKVPHKSPKGIASGDTAD